MRDLAGKVAVVTGAASGIGKAIVQRLAGEDMRILLVDVDERGLASTVEEVGKSGAAVHGVVADVSSADSVQAIAEETLAHFGGVHLVCSNAGVQGHIDGPIWEATAKDWQWILGVNLWGAVHMTQTFLPILLEQADGHLVITASATSYILPRDMYVVSKHSVAAYAELVYSQVKQLNSPVNVSLLCPGSVATHLFEHERAAPLQNPADPVRDQEAIEFRRRRAERNKGGVDPAEVAEALVDGIRDDRFYIFNDHEWDDRIRSRTEHVLRRENPQPMPPVARLSS